MNRFRQRVAALNYAIQTTPRPTTDVERNELFDLNMQLYELYGAANAIDLARDRLGAALALNPTEEYLQFRRLSRAGLQNQFNQLDQAIIQIEQRVEDQGLEVQARPVRPGRHGASAGGRRPGDHPSRRGGDQRR